MGELGLQTTNPGGWLGLSTAHPGHVLTVWTANPVGEMRLHTAHLGCVSCISESEDQCQKSGFATQVRRRYFFVEHGRTKFRKCMYGFPHFSSFCGRHKKVRYALTVNV